MSEIFTTLDVDDPEIGGIVAEFVERVRSGLGDMREALGRQDYESLQRLAHWLKGSGGTMGFAQLTAAARRLELAAETASLPDSAEHIAALEQLAERIMAPAAAAH